MAPSRPDAVEEDAKRTTEAAANDPRVLARKAAKEGESPGGLDAYRLLYRKEIYR